MLAGFRAELAAGGAVRRDRHPRARRSCRTTSTCTRPWCSRGGSARTRQSKAIACRYNLIDSAIALNAAFFVNAAILVLSAAVFHRHGVAVASIEEAHKLLPSFLGAAAPILFGDRPAVRGAELDADRARWPARS